MVVSPKTVCGKPALAPPMQASADAPCTVGNCGPGFDVLSLALARRGDTVSLAGRCALYLEGSISI